MVVQGKFGFQLGFSWCRVSSSVVYAGLTARVQHFEQPARYCNALDPDNAANKANFALAIVLLRSHEALGCQDPLALDCHHAAAQAAINAWDVLAQ